MVKQELEVKEWEEEEEEDDDEDEGGQLSQMN
jgi:hypothetical protein